MQTTYFSRWLGTRTWRKRCRINFQLLTGELIWAKARSWWKLCFFFFFNWSWLLICKEIKAVNPKRNQSLTFTGRTDVEAPILWPPNAKSWLTGNDPDAGKDWRQEEQGMTEDEMVGWHHWLDKHEFDKLWEMVKDREAWHAAGHGVTKSWIQLSDWTTNWYTAHGIIGPSWMTVTQPVSLAVKKLLVVASYFSTECGGNRKPLPHHPDWHQHSATGVRHMSRLIKWYHYNWHMVGRTGSAASYSFLASSSNTIIFPMCVYT